MKKEDKKAAAERADKKQKALDAAARKKAAIENEMSRTRVDTPLGWSTLFTLIRGGVDRIVLYYNIVEKNKNRVQLTSDGLPVTVVKAVDYGIKFANGFEIRHIDSKVFNYLKKQGYFVEEKRERLQSKTSLA